jgi:hypothetical protein
LERYAQRHCAVQGFDGDAAGRAQFANSYLIWSEVQYSYKPVIGYVVSGTLTLKDQIYMRPRLSDSVTRDT